MLVRSPQAHARIVKIDAEAARKAPGVVAVYSWADMEKEGSGYFVLPAMFPNADGTEARHDAAPPAGARGRSLRRRAGRGGRGRDVRAGPDAAELVEVEYEQLPSVTEIDDALKPDAPQVWKGAPGNRVGFNRFGDSAKADAAFAAAAHKVEIDIVHQRLIVNAMEPRAIMAEWDGDRMVVHIGSQNPSATRDILCDVILKMPKDKVRVLVRDIGGGFGMRTGIQPDESVAVWVAKVLKRPVKWRAERSEEFAVGDRRPRPAAQDGAGARQGRQDPGAAHGGLRQCRRLSVGRRHRHPAVRRAQGLDRHLRHSRLSISRSPA